MMGQSILYYPKRHTLLVFESLLIIFMTQCLFLIKVTIVLNFMLILADLLSLIHIFLEINTDNDDNKLFNQK